MNREAVNRAYYESGEWGSFRWRGIRTEKCPDDLFAYDRIIRETEADLIIETGTRFGGSATFMAESMITPGLVLTLDRAPQVQNGVLPLNVVQILGNSVNQEPFQKVQRLVRPKNRVMVVLDSDHSAEHVLRELDLYAPLVSVDCFLIVEDTNLNGHPVAPGWGPGPWEALNDWIPRHPEFEMNSAVEPFLTFNPGGYLRRIL